MVMVRMAAAAYVGTERSCAVIALCPSAVRTSSSMSAFEMLKSTHQRLTLGEEQAEGTESASAAHVNTAGCVGSPISDTRPRSMPI